MKISVHSGLGNQLFQFSFFHFLINRVNLNHKIQVVPEHNPRLDRKFELNELINLCEHSADISFKSKRFIYIHYLMEILLKYSNLVNEIKPFTFLDNLDKEYNSLNRFSHLTGYFQHWRYVDNSYHLFAVELNNYLNTIDTENIIASESFIGVHVRRGDNIYTLGSMGSLNDQYYLKTLEKINTIGLPVVLFTDDLKGASDVIKKVSPDYCFGPTDLTAWQTLKLMSKSTYLITANSTLSWWAAFIGVKSGRTNQVFIPDPWFRNWPDKISDAFHYPGFAISRSEFIDAPSFTTDYKLPNK